MAQYTTARNQAARLDGRAGGFETAYWLFANNTGFTDVATAITGFDTQTNSQASALDRVSKGFMAFGGGVLAATGFGTLASGPKILNKIDNIPSTSTASSIRKLDCDTCPNGVGGVGGSSANPASVRYGPHMEGPLGRDVANNFRGGSYSQVTLESDTIMYRVYGGDAQELRAWWSRTPPKGPLQARMDLALPPENLASNVV